MKKMHLLIIIAVLAIVAVGSFIFSACSKSSAGDGPDLTRGVSPVFASSAEENRAIDEMRTSRL